MIKGTYKHSPERLKKMSLAQTGHPVSEATRRKLHLIHKGKIYSPSTLVKKGDIFPERRKRVQIECKICNQPFEVKKSHAQRRMTCSKKCLSIYQGIKRKGKKIHDEEFKQRLRARNWKGGVTPLNKLIRKSEEYKLWRTAVFERDNYQCIWGGKEHGNKLNADHIKSFSQFPELRFAIDNGRTLCETCHKSTDSYLNRWYNNHI